MNIQVQTCGLVILVLLMLFYRSTKSLRMYTEKIFSHVLSAATLSISLDILSIVAIEYKNMMPLVLVESICKLYIVTLIWLTMYAFTYVLTDLYSKEVHKKRAKDITMIAFIEGIIVALLPIDIYKEGEIVYTYGPAVLFVYGCVLINIIATIIVSVVCIKKLNKRRVLAVSIWMCIWIFAAVIQFLNNELLIVGFAGAIGSLILFVIIENPEANLDRRIGCFNSYALSEYLKRLLEDNSSFSVLEISFGTSDSFNEFGVQLDETMRDMVEKINVQKQIKIFKSIDSNLVIIGENPNQLQKLGDDILKEYRRDSGLQKEIKAMLIPEGVSFDSIDDLYGFFRYLDTIYIENNEQVYLVQEELVNKYKRQDEIREKIEEALEEDLVEVFLQPIYSNHEKCFTSAEALVRIRQKDGSLLSPGIFIPIAEANGQIVDLGERVLEKVCEYLKNTEMISLGIHYIEINLSVVQCELKDLAERVIRIVERYQIEPSRINLEITETASISSRNTLLENMKKLIDYGFSFSLDDFGKGESNLMYIVEMPVSLVKLDYDISKAFFNTPKAKPVVKAVVGMAHELDLQLVAEGIETEEEINGMYHEGIDYIQGYYYSKPLPINEFLAFIKKENI